MALTNTSHIHNASGSLSTTRVQTTKMRTKRDQTQNKKSSTYGVHLEYNYHLVYSIKLEYDEYSSQKNAHIREDNTSICTKI